MMFQELDGWEAEGKEEYSPYRKRQERSTNGFWRGYRICSLAFEAMPEQDQGEDCKAVNYLQAQCEVLTGVKE